MVGTLTPAEISANQIHLLDLGSKTYCGIKFRHKRFLQKTAAYPDMANCEKCLKEKHKRVREEKEEMIFMKERQADVKKPS